MLYLKLQHSFLHALHIKEKAYELLYLRSQLGAGASAGAQRCHGAFFLAIINLQGVEFVGTLFKVLGAPWIACLISVEGLKGTLSCSQ